MYWKDYVDSGNTVIVIEHNLDVIKTADYLIDLGPEGGDEGGLVVANGTPEDVALSGTYTGEFLKHVLSDNELIKQFDVVDETVSEESGNNK